MISGCWFLGINLGTIRMETCLAPEAKVVNSKLCEALDRATSSDPQAPEARATKKAVLQDRSSNEMCLSVPLMANGGFIKPFRTMLRCHLGKTSCSLGPSIVILRMTLWRLLSCRAVGGFSNFRTLEIEALWTRIVFTFLFCVHQVLGESNIWKVTRKNVFVVSPKSKGFPMRVVHITGWILKGIRSHIHDRVGEMMAF